VKQAYQESFNYTLRTKRSTHDLVLLQGGKATVPAEEPVTAAELEVVVRSVGSTQGRVLVAVYDKASGFGKAMLTGAAKVAVKGDMHFSFPELPPGDYAVLAFHDTNNSGRLDKNAMGIPLKPWGGSLQGKPMHGAYNWNDMRFNLTGSGKSVSIELH